MSKPTLFRRSLLGGFVAALIAAVAGFFGKGRRAMAGMRLRPPGALAEEEFLDACARCFKCSNACPNDCIKVYGLSAGLGKALTPYIQARSKACTLCGECGKACPTGALKPFEDSKEGWQRGVNMGTARVNRSMCYSYHGRTCGACYRACPLAGQAITIGMFETPILDPQQCVGCGLCEQACLHLPQAIRVIPDEVRKPKLMVLRDDGPTEDTA